MRALLVCIALASSAVACSGSTSSGSGTTSGADGGTASNGNGSGNGDGSGNGNGATGPLAYKTYVTLGDSISDRGGGSPFFYDLLVQNDDAKYPSYKGKDLKTRYGADIKVVHASKSGAVSRGLVTQAQGLPADLPGPVLVTITIGGNDMRAAILDILGNRDTADRADFQSNLDKTYDELTKPDRFGAGVQVKVFHASIYDPSDGNGDFKGGGCPAPLNLIDPQPTTTFFTNWNTVVTTELAKYPAAVVVDAYGRFNGHGVSHLKDGTSWYANDCIHPSTTGHDEMRKVFWSAITGEAG